MRISNGDIQGQKNVNIFLKIYLEIPSALFYNRESRR